MIIEKMSLKNYRQYRAAKIAFAFEEGGKRFTIIQGTMGSGKTNILNSISWCLYGKERHISDKYRALPIVNSLTLKNLEKNQPGEVRVEMVMRDEDNKKIIFARHFKFKKEEGYDYDTIQEYNTDPKTNTVFDIYRQVGRDMVLVEEPVIYANKVFPEDIQEYFFFDGERLDDYFRTVSYEKVKEEVFRISQLNILENVIIHLDKVAKGYSQEAKGLNPKADELKRDIDELERDIISIGKELERVWKDKEEANKLKETCNEKLRNYPSSGEVNRLQIRREEIEKEYKRIQGEKTENEEERLSYLTEMAPILLSSRALKSTLGLIEKKIKAGELPPKIKKDFLENIIKEGKCICGSDVKSGTKSRERLTELLKECRDLDELTIELSDEKVRVKFALDRIGEFAKELEKLSKAILGAESKLAQLDKESATIDNTLAKYDLEDIRQLESEYEAAKHKFEELAIEYGRLSSEKDRKVNILKRKKQEWQFECKKDEKKSKITQALVFCENGLEETRKIKEEIMEELRAEIEEKTQRQFFALIWKKFNFKSVKIDEHWKFSVMDTLGRESIGSFSAGERQCLALSFLAALNIVSGFNFPIIMDTPLARIAKEPRLNIASKLPAFLSEKQVIMLLTDEEYTTEVRNAIRKHVGAEYKIKFNDLEYGCESTLEQYEK